MTQLSREFKTAAAACFSGDTDAFATTLLGILLRVYGAEVLNWDGITIQLEVKDDFEVDMPRRVYDRLMALINAMTSNTVYTNVPVFDETVSALAGKGVGKEQDVPPVDDVAWAVREIALNDPEPEGRLKSDPWSKAIKKYVRVVLDDEGMPIPPKALDFAGERTIPLELEGDEGYYSGVWGVQAERAKEVDVWIDERVAMLMGQLSGLGIKAEDPKSLNRSPVPG